MIPLGSRGRRTSAVLLALATVTLTLATSPADAAPATRAVAVRADRSAGAYRPPLDGDVVVRRAFEPPPQPWLAGHRGVDLAAARGATVLSPADGAVVFAGAVAGRGVVSILHDDGLRTSLEPVIAVVAVGTRVRSGDVVASVTGDLHGDTTLGTGLHWGVRDGERYVDPWGLLPGRGPVVLLPVR